MMNSPWSRGRLGLVVLVLGLACAGRVGAGKLEAADLGRLRMAALDDLFVLREYRAGKNSFVESPERHQGVWTGAGYRYTLLDLEGQGSLRHIWTTRGDGDPYFDWEFYVDGESAPSIRATDVQLIAGAEAFPVPVAPANYLPVHNRAFNFYLPVPFDRSLRVEVVQRQPTFWLWFCQMDYRLEDNALAGARLFGHPAGDGVAFSYVGLPHQQRTASASRLPMRTEEAAPVAVAPGDRRRLLTARGPAIGRECRIRWEGGETLRLLVRYDGAESFAIDSPAHRFFGPFEGVSFYRHATNDASCYLPMPFRQDAEIWVENQGTEPVAVAGSLQVEPVPAFAAAWGYLHARHARTDRTDGHRPHQVLYVRGRGHWVGMTLYRTGHDHGGGDFAVIDGEGERPAFLHGINGEDYFTFAWFGQGAHHPYAMAHSNDDGRYRHHFENLYPFRESIAIEWGAFAGLSPESVAVWYQDVPGDTTVADGARAESVEWDVFGPVPIPHDAAGRATVDLFSVLPRVEDLDAGGQFECRLVKEHFTAGWVKEWSVGPMLNLTYLGRHGTKIDYEAELGGNGHAALARRYLESDRERTARCLFAHDDPVEVWVNRECVYRGESRFNGFEANWIELPLRRGRNEIVVRLTNYFNRNFNWSGFLFRVAKDPG
ncbi:MAG: DUF2961 domain-containing protein [Verrucomicrobia bacterium]|nr:DUF2961 domain-containing protein [Verrucomicrobiota bacterium]